MKRRAISLLLAACMLCGLLTVGASAASSTQTGAVETVKALGIMVGDESGNMNLTGNVTRAQFVKMMTAASSYKDSIGAGYGYSLFKDVKSDYWASEYIKLAVEQEWITGYVDGTFRPNNTVTLEEACAALLRMLGYDSSSLAGSYPTAQLSKASAVGLLDGMSATQGQKLTRSDCVTLFNNLLTAENSDGNVYAVTLGYTVTNGEVDYSTLVAADTKGPFVSDNGSVELPFGTQNVTVYYDGTSSTLSAVENYDVYYYNTNLRTVWVYHERVTGTITALSPSKTAPTAVTVAGNEYEITTSAAAYKLSTQGEYQQGDVVTLLLGMNGDVVDVVSATAGSTSGTYYGVVVSSEKDGGDSDSASVRNIVQVACTDGSVRTFYTNSSASVGRLVTVTADEDGASIRTLSNKSVSGTVNSAATKLGTLAFADNVEILDTDSDGGYVRIYPSRLAGVKLSDSDVRYYELDKNGDISRMILNKVTGDTATYGFITSAQSYSGDMSVSGSYQYIIDGKAGTISSASQSFNVEEGGAAFHYDTEGNVTSIKNLKSVKITSLYDLYVTADSERY
ncbi:MAG: S-layer homology domain-containing protein, partial [Clostridiales bacterium]|nr:S-layer homology domain-containing protein [Clostridiales bacterium]